MATKKKIVAVKTKEQVAEASVKLARFWLNDALANLRKHRYGLASASLKTASEVLIEVRPYIRFMQT
jgi:hypothetical protein